MKLIKTDIGNWPNVAKALIPGKAIDKLGGALSSASPPGRKGMYLKRQCLAEGVARGKRHMVYKPVSPDE